MILMFELGKIKLKTSNRNRSFHTILANFAFQINETPP